MAVQKSAKQTTPAKKVSAKAVKATGKVASSLAKKAAAAKPAAAKIADTAKKAVPPKNAAKHVSPASPASPVAHAPMRRASTAGHAPAKKAAAPAKKAAPPAKAAPAAPEARRAPTVKGTTKDGIAYTKDFDVKFLSAQKAALLQQRGELVGQATRLEDEANSLIEEQEMGDVEFGDEGGEGDTMVVERERDLALSAQARQMVEDIDAALARLAEGTYGYSLLSWRPIPRERLEAIPWATALVEEKVGGLGRR